MSYYKQIIATNFTKKSKKEQWRSTKKAVIYTRVSTKEQAEGNTSLDMQKRECILYADRKGYTVIGDFGGTYESAKTEERKELKRMLAYVKSDVQVEAIIVYAYDRFSRSVDSINTLQQLKKIGITVLAVTQDIDPKTISGALQMNISLLFANSDNETRRNRTVNGMIENLRNGYWTAACPFGYTNLAKKDKAKNHNYVINEDGEKLRLAFRWKAEGKLSNKEIFERLHKIGCGIHYKSLSRILQNPFYCGYIVHALLGKEVIKGRHVPLVSESLFLRANKVLADNPLVGKSKRFRIEALPLKGFAIDEVSRSPFTGYKQKRYFYYKTRDKGTRVNVNADKLNQMFADKLKKFQVSSAIRDQLKVALKDNLVSKLNDRIKEAEAIKSKLTRTIADLEKIEERFAIDEIPRSMYLKFSEKYSLQISNLQTELAKSHFNSSNIEKLVEKGLELSGNPSELWLSSDYMDKQRLQRLVFPEGILYNKENDAIRTLRTNTIFSLIAATARVLEQKNDCKSIGNNSHSHWVASPRIELGSKV